MLRIRAGQHDILEEDYQKRRTMKELDSIFEELSKQDPEFEAKKSALSDDQLQSFWRKVDGISDYEEDDLELMKIFVETRIDLFEHAPYLPVLRHPFLTNEAKVRHLILASQTLTQKVDQSQESRK